MTAKEGFLAESWDAFATSVVRVQGTGRRIVRWGSIGLLLLAVLFCWVLSALSFAGVWGGTAVHGVMFLIYGAVYAIHVFTFSLLFSARDIGRENDRILSRMEGRS